MSARHHRRQRSASNPEMLVVPSVPLDVPAPETSRSVAAVSSTPPQSLLLAGGHSPPPPPPPSVLLAESTVASVYTPSAQRRGGSISSISGAAGLLKSTALGPTGAPPRLTVRVHAAKDLLPKDMNGTSDPFVKLWETSTEKGNLNPTWNAAHTLDVNVPVFPDASSPALIFEVLNEYKFGKITGQLRNIGKQAFLGLVEVPLSALLHNPAANLSRRWYPLQKRSEKSHVRGALELSFELEGVPSPVPARSLSVALSVAQSAAVATSTTTTTPAAAAAMTLSSSTDTLNDADEPPRALSVSVSEMAAAAAASRRERGRDDCALLLRAGSMHSSLGGPAPQACSGGHSLHIVVSQLSDVPQLGSRHKSLAIEASVRGKKGRSENIDITADNCNGEIALSSTSLVLPLDTNLLCKDMPTLKISLLVVRAGGFFESSLGLARLSLSAIPVLDDPNQAAIDDLMPVDIYLERTLMSFLPPGTKLRNTLGSVCRMRVKLYIVLNMPASPDTYAVDDNGNDTASDDEWPAPPSSSTTSDGQPAASASTATTTATTTAAAAADAAAAIQPYDWELLQETFPISLSKLHKHLFDKPSAFMDEFVEAKKYTKVTIGDWADQKRELRYTIPKSSVVKANEAIESQSYVLHSKRQIVVNVSTACPEVPYGKEFLTNVQYSLTAISRFESHLKVTAGIQFFSAPLLKRVISNSAKSGMTSTFQLFGQILKKHATPLVQSAPATQLALSAGGGLLEGADGVPAADRLHDAAAGRSMRRGRPALVAALVATQLTLLALVLALLWRLGGVETQLAAVLHELAQDRPGNAAAALNACGAP